MREAAKSPPSASAAGTAVVVAKEAVCAAVGSMAAAATDAADMHAVPGEGRRAGGDSSRTGVDGSAIAEVVDGRCGTLAAGGIEGA